MKQYHTTIEIEAPVAQVWQHLTNFKAYPIWNPLVGELTGDLRQGGKISTYIVPLGKIYRPKVLEWKENKALVWQGVQGAKFLMAGKHYYRLEAIEGSRTKLLHGEWFTGLFSWFIPKSLLNKMENAFIEHNNLLKQRVENEK